MVAKVLKEPATSIFSTETGSILHEVSSDRNSRHIVEPICHYHVFVTASHLTLSLARIIHSVSTVHHHFYSCEIKCNLGTWYITTKGVHFVNNSNLRTHGQS